MEKQLEEKGLQLEDLKVSNLPELQGWREKQEKLVADNPYVEIIDNKTYTTACQSRTALLKGRTELEKQDKLIASKVAAFRKDVKTETDNLIAITLPSEEKQQAEVKRYETIKEAEKQEKERIERERVEKIKSKIDLFESDSYRIIQETNISNVELNKTMLDAFVNAEFDYEEYDILFEQARGRVQASWDAKCTDIQEQEEQRLENERLEKENAEAKRLSDLQASRLNEILPYVAFGEAVDLTNLSGLEESDYSNILASKKALFEADAKEKQEAQDRLDAENLERENKAKADKEKIFEIRKNRLAEIGFRFLENQDRFLYEDKNIAVSKLLTTIFDADAIDFETIITDAKLAIEKAKSEAKEEVFKKRKETLESVALLEEEITHIHSDKIGRISFEDLYNCQIVSDEDFNFVMDEVRASQKANDEQLAKEDAERLKKENKARVKRLDGEKKALSVSLGRIKNVFIEEFTFVKYDNEETETFRGVVEVKVDALIDELLTELEKL